MNKLVTTKYTYLFVQNLSNGGYDTPDITGYPIGTPLLTHDKGAHP